MISGKYIYSCTLESVLIQLSQAKTVKVFIAQYQFGQDQFGIVFHYLAQMNFHVHIKKINLGTLFTLSKHLTLIYKLFYLTSMFSSNENRFQITIL